MRWRRAERDRRPNHRYGYRSPHRHFVFLADRFRAATAAALACLARATRASKAYADGRGWVVANEFVDEGISGSHDRRPALDRLMADARRGRVDVICVWSLDRFGRSLARVVTAVQELHECGVAFISLREGLNLSTAAGRLHLDILSAPGEFERARLIERTKAGLAGARRQGTRPGHRPVRLTATQLAEVAGLPVRAAARQLGVSVNTDQKSRRAVCQQTAPTAPVNQA